MQEHGVWSNLHSVVLQWTMLQSSSRLTLLQEDLSHLLSLIIQKNLLLHYVITLGDRRTTTFRPHVTNNVQGLWQLAFGSLISSVCSVGSNRKFSWKIGFVEVLLRFFYILAFLSTTPLHTDEKKWICTTFALGKYVLKKSKLRSNLGVDLRHKTNNNYFNSSSSPCLVQFILIINIIIIFIILLFCLT